MTITNPRFYIAAIVRLPTTIEEIYLTLVKCECVSFRPIQTTEETSIYLVAIY